MEKLRAEMERKKEITDEIARIKDMRKGSVVEQFYEVKRKDGSAVRQGPYYLYSYKENGKTRSRRLSGPGQAQLYREQIEEFRRFEELSSDLIETCHRICDLKAAAQASEDQSPKKKSRKRSRRKSSGKSKG